MVLDTAAVSHRVVDTLRRERSRREVIWLELVRGSLRLVLIGLTKEGLAIRGRHLWLVELWETLTTSIPISIRRHIGELKLVLPEWNYRLHVSLKGNRLSLWVVL